MGLFLSWEDGQYPRCEGAACSSVSKVNSIILHIQVCVGKHCKLIFVLLNILVYLSNYKLTVESRFLREFDMIRLVRV